MNTPWNVRIESTQDGQGGFTVLSLIGSDGRTVIEKRLQGPPREEDIAIYQLAAQAVNVHNDLVEALDNVTAALETMMVHFEDKLGPEDRKRRNGLIEIARAVLKKTTA